MGKKTEVMDETTQQTTMVSKGDLDKVMTKLLKTDEDLAVDLEQLLLHVKTKSIEKGLNQRLAQCKKRIEAMKAGFVPVHGGWWSNTETKSRWAARDVKDTLATMPDDIKEAWERVKLLGVFDSFGVSRGGGDPVLVGNTGGKHYLIGAWVNLEGGLSIGFKVR